MPIWTPTYSASSATTLIIYPQWTTTGTTLTWTNGNAPYLWQTISSGTPLLNGSWQSFGFAHPENQPRTLAEAYEPPSREELNWLLKVTRRAERAEALLASLLDESQFRDYIERGWFEVIGSAGGRYRIRRNGQAGNVDEMPPAGDERDASLCIHPYGGYHDADAHAAQFLALVTDELAFRRTANRTPHRRRPAGMAA